MTETQKTPTIALINLPLRTGLKVINIGMYYIARIIKDAGYKLTILDCVSDTLGVPDIIAILKEVRPKLVGLSGLVTTYYFLEPLCREIKQHFPEIDIVVGASVGSSMPYILGRYTDVDFVVEGEGEEAILEFLDRYKTGKQDFSDVAGFYYRENGSMRYTFPRTYEGASVGALDKYPYPLYEAIDMEFYISNLTKMYALLLNQLPEYKNKTYRVFPLVPTRGCPYSCAFCFRLIKKHRTHSVDYLIEQIKYLKDTYDVRGFYLYDELIMTNQKWLASFCDRVVDENLGVIFFSGGGKPNMVTNDLLVKMKRAGFVKLGYGVESGSQKILDRMNKKTTVEQNYNAIMNTYEAGIFSQSNFVFGFPGEDKNTIRETTQFISRTNKTKENYQIFFLAVYPGTSVYNYALSKGIIKDEHDYLLKVMGQDAYILNLSDFPSRNDLIFHVYKYLHLYDGVTCIRNGRVVSALNRWLRIALSFATFYLSGKKWPRCEDFAKHILTRLGLYNRNKLGVYDEYVDPFRSRQSCLDMSKYKPL